MDDFIAALSQKYLSLLEHAGHEQTIFYLGLALLLGSDLFILHFTTCFTASTVKQYDE